MRRDQTYSLQRVRGLCKKNLLEFCPARNFSYTKWLAKFVLALQAEMSIRAVAQFTGLHWQSVKDIEKAYLVRKYSKPSLRTVKHLGIDEVYLARKLDFITIVRNLENGAVQLFRTRSKGFRLHEKPSPSGVRKQRFRL